MGSGLECGSSQTPALGTVVNGGSFPLGFSPAAEEPSFLGHTRSGIFLPACFPAFTIVGSTRLLFSAIYIGKANPGPEEDATLRRASSGAFEGTAVGWLLFCGQVFVQHTPSTFTRSS